MFSPEWKGNDESQWGHDGISSGFSKKKLKTINSEYNKNLEENYQKWLKNYKEYKKDKFNFSFLMMAFERGDING
jgi:hypothetical protein